MRKALAISHVAALVALAGPVRATPQQDLNRAYQFLQNARYPQARDLARAYLIANGPRFSAAFIVAAAECKLHPHQPANAAPFRQLRIDYTVSPDKNRDIAAWIQQCASPPPPPQTQEAGVSASGLTVQLSMNAAQPTDNEPPSRLPKRPPPKASDVVVASPVVAVPMTPVADRCLQGYVWREAYAGDHVCVVPATRAQAADDNRQASAHRDPNGPYGPDTCIQGYVWREARTGDVVCVIPDRRAQAAQDNRQAAARRVP